MLNPINTSVKSSLNSKLNDLEEAFTADVIGIYGPIESSLTEIILHVIEELKQDKTKVNESLMVVLTTPGGDAITVERIANIFRHHYNEVNFIIPDYAFSAGTILCMSGDNIYMDYYSVLGPIDPQVMNKDGRFVPALGYLDKVNQLLEKAKANEICEAEYLILKDFDLAELRAYEQAKELTVDLLKKWLVSFKFKNWNTHSKTGLEVQMDEKVAKAEEIAKVLGDSSKWKSHGRPLDIETLHSIGLKIENYSDNQALTTVLREYQALVIDHIRTSGYRGFIHTRRFI